MKKKILSVILAAALTCSMVVGCGSSKETAKDDKAATSSSDGFNVTVNFASEPMTMDPALNSTVDGGVMANHLFEGLMKWQDKIGRASCRERVF